MLKTPKKGLRIYAQSLGHSPSEKRDVIGTLNELEKNEYLRFERLDQENGKSYWIPASWIETVEEDGIHLNKTIDEVKGGMMDSPPPA